MDKHTPGTWYVGRMLEPRNARAVIGDDDSVVAILPGDWNGCTYIKADARLIAAAPDLLAAAFELVSTLREEHDITARDDDYIYDTLGSSMAAAYFSARAAIAKATGG